MVHDDHAKFLEALEASQVGAKLHEEIARRRLTDRKALAKQLEAARAAYIEEAPSSAEAVDRAVAEVRAAEIALAHWKQTPERSQAGEGSAR